MLKDTGIFKEAFFVIKKILEEFLNNFISNTWQNEETH